MYQRGLALFVLSLLAFVDVWAVKVQRPFYTLREKGQGGAIISASTDFSAIMFNPANMADHTEGHLNMGFGGFFTSSFTEFQSDFKDFAGEENDTAKAIKFNDLVNEYEGEEFAGGFDIYGLYSGTKWGFGFIPLNEEANIKVYSDRFKIGTYVDSMMMFGTGRRINDKWSWGTTLKAVYRAYANLEITAADIATVEEEDLFDSADAISGATVDLDLAANYKGPKIYNIDTKYSVVLRNLVDSGFNINQDGQGSVPKLQRSLDLGSQFTFKKVWVFTPQVLFDIRDIGISDWDFQTGYHLGAELQWHAYSWLKGAYRVGINQGYFTAGINMQMTWFRLDLVTWGEEVGTKEERSESKRVALNLSMDF